MPQVMKLTKTITADGDQAGIIKAGSDVLRIRSSGTFDGATISINVHSGANPAQGISDAGFISRVTMTAADEVAYNIGMGEEYTISASSTGTTSVVLEITNCNTI